MKRLVVVLAVGLILLGATPATAGPVPSPTPCEAAFAGGTPQTHQRWWRARGWVYVIVDENWQRLDGSAVCWEPGL